MSKNSNCIRSRSVIARYLGIGAMLLATMGLAPAVVAADDDSTHRSAEATGAPERQQGFASDRQRTASGLTLSIDDAVAGEEVRASHQEANGAAKARSEAQSGEAQSVRTISPNDPEWDQVHQGG